MMFHIHLKSPILRRLTLDLYMIRRLLFLLISVSFSPLFAQTSVAGKIIDKSTQKGISASIIASERIFLENNGISTLISSGEVVAESNEYGEFTLPGKPANQSKFSVNVQGETFDIIYTGEIRGTSIYRSMFRKSM